MHLAGKKADTPPPGPQLLRYEIRYSENNPVLEIVLRFQADASGQTLLQLPSRSGPITGLYKTVENMQVVAGDGGADATLVSTSDPSQSMLTSPHSAGREMVVSYRIKQSWNGTPTPDKFLAPILQPTYFQFRGSDVFVYPAGYGSNNKQAPLQFEFDWKHVPAQWSLSNSFGTNQRTQMVQGTVKYVLGGLFLAGEYRLQSMNHLSYTGCDSVVSNDNWDPIRKCKFS